MYGNTFSVSRVHIEHVCPDEETLPVLAVTCHLAAMAMRALIAWYAFAARNQYMSAAVVVVNDSSKP